MADDDLRSLPPPPTLPDVPHFDIGAAPTAPSRADSFSGRPADLGGVPAPPPAPPPIPPLPAQAPQALPTPPAPTAPAPTMMPSPRTPVSAPAPAVQEGRADPYTAAVKNLADMQNVIENNYVKATRDLNLTPQEQFLYQQHLINLAGSGKVYQPDGNISTLRQATITENGKVYNIPTVWDGKVLPVPQSIEMAKQIGLNKFPSYSSVQEAQSRYDLMHQYMEKDDQYLKQGTAAQRITVPSGSALPTAGEIPSAGNGNGQPFQPAVGGRGPSGQAGYQAGVNNVQEMIAAGRKLGASDAAIAGAFANILNEGGFQNNWLQARSGENSFGHFQLNRNGELPGYVNYLQQTGQKNTSAAQMEYYLQTMESRHPGYLQITDPNKATQLGLHLFERPAGHENIDRTGSVANALKLIAGDYSGGFGPHSGWGSGGGGGGGIGSTGQQMQDIFHQAVVNKDPNGLLQLMAITPRPPGFEGNTARLMSSESLMMALAIANGHADQVPAIQDAFSRLSYLGVNENLFHALRALQAGDADSAASFLDKSHSFFPDFTKGKYSKDANGNLYMQRIGEATGKPIGNPIKVTPEAIMSQMQFTNDPERYFKVLADQQKAMSKAELDKAEAEYRRGFNATKILQSQITERANIERSLIAERARRYAADAAAANNTKGQVTDEQFQTGFMRPFADDIPNLVPQGMDQNSPEYATRSAGYLALAQSMANNSGRSMSPAQASAIIRQLNTGQLKPAPDQQHPGKVVLVDKAGNTASPPIDEAVAVQYLGYTPQRQAGQALH